MASGRITAGIAVLTLFCLGEADAQAPVTPASPAATAPVTPAAPAATTPNHPPVAAFGELPDVANPQMSPDGKHLITIENLRGRPAAVIRSADVNGDKPTLIHSEKEFIVYARWAKDHHALIWLASTYRRGWFGRVHSVGSIISVDVTGTLPVPRLGCGPLSSLSQAETTIVDYFQTDPQYVFLPSRLGGFAGSIAVLCRISVSDSSGTVVASGTANTNQWIMDGDGHLIGRIDQTKNPLKDHLILYSGNNKWTEVAAIDASGGTGLDIEGISEDGKSLVIGTVSPTTGMSGLTALNMVDGSPSDLFYSPRHDVSNTLLDPWTQRTVGVTVIEDRAIDHYFSAEFKAIQAGLQVAFADKTVHALSWDRAHNRLTVAVSGPHNPPSYYVFDRTTHHADLLLQTYAGLAESDLGDVVRYPYKARDGLEIPAYLTFPPGKPGKNLPVVILPHGGPMARDDIDFDWEAQFLANRGYAVLQPNFRGSTGYGTKFLEAGFGEWGLKMQDDITDGVRKLIADGIADPKRICIVGGSYGGYAALAGAAFTPDLYACAAGWAGVYDLRDFLSDRAHDYGEDSAMISSWSRFIGDRTNDAAKLDAASPADHADKIVCPVLLVHGADDTTVRIEQSERMARTLRRAGRKVTFVTIDGETHYMETSATRIRWLTELESFLKASIGN